MGMGKTLSILALVTKTLERAHKWASTSTEDEVDSLLPMKKRAAATLVVVPSARKSYYAETFIACSPGGV
jgi:SWI/SNF-related matrix-associated actin-dependent regulator of chromatin subfamily A3